MASTVGDEKAGNQDYQTNHMALLFEEGLSFSGFERDALFLNREGSRFQDISGVSGIDSISDGRSAVTVDLDNDGDLDIFLTTIQGEGHLLFRNNVGQDKAFIRVELQGTKSGRDAFGAQVRVKTPLGVQTRILSGGSGFMAQPDRRLLFGLGENKEAEWMEVTWPSGTRQRLGPISAGTSLKLVEEEPDYQTLSLPSGALPDPLEEEQVLWSKLAIKRGLPMPNLALKTLPDGEEVSLPLEKGTSYLVNLWATWCGPCRREMPELEAAKAKLEENGIKVIGLSLDQGVPLADVESYARDLGVSYPIYLLEQEDLKKIFAGDERFVPFSILVDEEGRVADSHAGWGEEAKRKLDRLCR